MHIEVLPKSYTGFDKARKLYGWDPQDCIRSLDYGTYKRLKAKGPDTIMRFYIYMGEAEVREITIAEFEDLYRYGQAKFVKSSYESYFRINRNDLRLVQKI
jgi:hypothetical protein